MKGLMKAFSDGSGMWRGWRVVVLLRESIESVLVVTQLLGGVRDGLIL